MCDLGCAPKSAGTGKSSTYVARQLATAGLQLAAAMMTRTRIIQRYTRVKFTLFSCTSADLFFSCCDSVAAPQQRPGHHGGAQVASHGAATLRNRGRAKSVDDFWVLTLLGALPRSHNFLSRRLKTFFECFFFRDYT